MFITILLFIFILGILILSHEFGHFIVAKKSGMRVDEFGFGFPPRIFGIKKGETLYSFNLFPIGGFVKIYGEDGGNRNDKKSFSNKPIWVRFSTLTAGVIMNVLVAYLFFSFGHIIGTPTAVSPSASDIKFEEKSVQILGVVKNSPAELAGLKLADKIRSISSGESSIVIQEASEVREFIFEHEGESFIFSIERGDKIENIIVNSRKEFSREEGSVGIEFIDIGIVRYPWYSAFWEGLKTTVYTTKAMILAFSGTIKAVVSTGSLPGDIAGPIGIAVFTGTIKDLGFVYILQFIAIISLNLAILNIIPFPALDGGRVLFLLIEKIKGSPVSKKVEGFAHSTGFALLILLIILITFHDINNL